MHTISLMVKHVIIKKYRKNRTIECVSLSFSFLLFSLLYCLSAEKKLCEVREIKEKKLLSNSLSECNILVTRKASNVRRKVNVYLLFFLDAVDKRRHSIITLSFLLLLDNNSSSLFSTAQSHVVRSIEWSWKYRRRTNIW
jgi:hypothetical protein